MNNFKSNQNINSSKAIDFNKKIKKALEKLKHPPMSFKQSNTLNMTLVKNQLHNSNEFTKKINEVKNVYKKKNHAENDYDKNK